MTPALVITFGALLWILAGFSVAGVAGRNGHFLSAWLALGAVCGPLTWSLYQRSLSREAEAHPQMVASGHPGRGPVAVLVGVDGSDGSHAATTTISGLLGERSGRLAIVSVLENDTALDRYAVEQRLDLIVIGSRGRGLTKALLGGTATELTTRCREPVLIVGAVEGTPEQTPSR